MQAPRSFFRLLLLALLCAPAAMAQQPAKTLKLIVAYPPGGAPDTLARALAQKITERGHYSVVIDNRPGAAGGVAVEALKASSPDGLTVALFDSATTAISPNLRSKVSYDPLRDFKPVGLVATSPIFLVARSDLGSTLPEVLAALKAKPGQMYGSSGNGSAHHLAMELLKLKAGLDLQHVPYKGSSQTVPAVAAGDVAITFAGITNARPFVTGGKVRVLATAEPNRSRSAPEVPTMAEAGVKDYAMTINLGIVGPAGMPAAAVKALNTEFSAAADAEDVKSKLAGLGVDSKSSTPDAYAALIANELKSYAEIVRLAKIPKED